MPSDYDRPEVLVELEIILASAAFGRSRRLRDLLQFVVLEYLAGNENNLKEATIGVHVFDRSPGYDTSTDSIVRTTAVRLRQRLRKYYDTVGRTDSWMITLPDEGYIPLVVKRSLVDGSIPGFERDSDSTGHPTHQPTSTEGAPQTPVLSIPEELVSSGKETLPLARPTAPFPSAPRVIRSWSWLRKVAAAFAAFAIIPMAIWRLSGGTAVVIGFSQLTNDGIPKLGPLLTNGSRLYFQESIDGKNVLSSVPVHGGTMTHTVLPALLGDPTVLDILKDSNQFILCGNVTEGKIGLWAWTPGTLPNLLNIECFGPWIPAAFLAHAAHTTPQTMPVNIRNSSRRMVVPGVIEHPQWLPSRQLLRFTVADPHGGTFSLWEMHGLQGDPKPVRGYPPSSHYGMWSPDGRIFAFQANRNTADGGDDIWVAREGGSVFSSDEAKPFRLTQGPLDYRHPIPGADGKSIFAIGAMKHTELARFDVGSRQYSSLLGGLSMLEADVSRNGAWITYASYPDRILWKIRYDGTGATQLTLPPFQVLQPHWSPDGARIAFMGQFPGQPVRLYLIPSAGGTPESITESDVDPGVPTWSPDGLRIAFGERRYSRPDPQMQIHILDLASHRASTLPGSLGTWTARWSPNGRFIAATSTDFHRLRLFDWGPKTWKELAAFRIVDNPMWTADSSHIYFSTLSDRGECTIYRIGVHGEKLERVVDPAKFGTPAPDWHGLAPDGTLLTVRSQLIEEVYRLTIKW